MGALGWVFGELALGKAIFRGDSDIDTLWKIFQRCGTPSGKDKEYLENGAHWSGFIDNLPQWNKVDWFKIRNLGEQIGKDGCDLLDKLLQYKDINRFQCA